MSKEYLKCDNGHFFEKSSNNFHPAYRALRANEVITDVCCLPFALGRAIVRHLEGAHSAAYVCPDCGRAVFV
jgi:hypothetical protein